MSLQRLDCTALSVNHLFLVARIDRYMLYGRQLSSRGKMFALGVPDGQNASLLIIMDLHRYFYRTSPSSLSSCM